MALFSLISWLCLMVIAPTIHSRDCAGTAEFLDGSNIQQFDGCEYVHGNLIINHNSTASNSAHPITSSNSLLLLSNITEIDGYLSIQNFNMSTVQDLRFLRRLQVIRGEETVLFFGVQHYSLIIQDNPHLRTLNLASLRRVENGGVRIVSNPELCLVDTISVEGFLVSSRLARVGGLGQNCSEFHCAKECLQSSGCWGTLPDECVTCRAYQYMGTCVNTCNTSVSYANAASRECVLLTPTLHTPRLRPDSTPEDPAVNMPHGHTASTIDRHETDNMLGTVAAPDSSDALPTHLVWTFSAVGSIVVVGAILYLLFIFFFIFHRSKKKKRKMSLLQTKQAKQVGESGSHGNSDSDGEGEGEEGVLISTHSPSISGSVRASRRSRVSLTSLVSSKFRVQEYSQGGGAEAAKEEVKLPARGSIVSESDSVCYDPVAIEASLALNSSGDSHVTTQSSHVTSLNCHVTPQSSHVISSPFHNHYSGISPPATLVQQQRPKTMNSGGVYSTGHGHHHHLLSHRHSNHFHGNISNSSISSSTVGYGTGTSARTSARTSRSTSRQFGSDTMTTGYSSAVLGPTDESVMAANSGKDSKSPSQQRPQYTQDCVEF